MTLVANTDGASRGNPGESGIGVIVRDETGKEILRIHGHIGVATNNEAEYIALETLLRGVRKLKNPPCTRLLVHSDSELMVKQVNGEYRVKDEGLRKHFSQVARLLEQSPFTVEVKHIPREQNRDADRLANIGIDTRKKLRV